MKKFILPFLALLVFLTACKRDPDAVVDPQNPAPVPSAIAAGFGPSNAAFSGTSWKLPQGVELVDSIHDVNFCMFISSPSRFEEYKNFRGLPGGVFQLCMTFRNTTGTPVIVDFPESVLVTSSHIRSQNGLLLFTGSVIIPANGTKTIMVGGFCVNLGRHAPDVFDENDNLLSYSFGPSALPSGLSEIKDILKPKHISYLDVVEPDGTLDTSRFQKYSTIQQAIWQVTDEGGLTAEMRTALKAL